MRTIPILSVVALAAGLAGYAGYRTFAAKTTITPAEIRSIVSPEKHNNDQVIIASIPDFQLTDRQGARKSFRDFDQAILVYNFWATWCAPCRREIPLLNRLRRDRKAQGVEIVGVAVDFRADVLKYATQIGIDYPLLIGEEDGLEALQAFGIPGAFPVSVFANKDKQIVTVKLGELHADEAAFILDRVADLNDRRMDLATAKQQISAKLQEFAQQRAKADAAASAAGL